MASNFAKKIVGCTSAIGVMILFNLIIFAPLFIVEIAAFYYRSYFTYKLVELLMKLTMIWAVCSGLYYGIYYIFAINIIALHRKGGKTALNYSKSLVKGRWWKTLWIMVVPYLISLVLFYLLEYMFDFLPVGSDIIRYFSRGIICSFAIVTASILFLNFDYISDENRKVENGMVILSKS